MCVCVCVCVCVQEAASFDPEPLHHSCLGQKEGIVTSFSWPQGHRLSLKLPEQGWVSTGNISGVQKEAFGPRTGGLLGLSLIGLIVSEEGLK